LTICPGYLCSIIIKGLEILVSLCRGECTINCVRGKREGNRERRMVENAGEKI